MLWKAVELNENGVARIGKVTYTLLNKTEPSDPETRYIVRSAGGCRCILRKGSYCMVFGSRKAPAFKIEDYVPQNGWKRIFELIFSQNSKYARTYRHTYGVHNYVTVVQVEEISEEMLLSIESVRDYIVKKTNMQLLRNLNVALNLFLHLDRKVPDYTVFDAAAQCVEPNPGPKCCWNCGGEHNLALCPSPKDPVRIKEAKTKARRDCYLRAKAAKQNSNSAKRGPRKGGNRGGQRKAWVAKAAIHELQQKQGENDALKEMVNELKANENKDPEDGNNDGPGPIVPHGGGGGGDNHDPPKDCPKELPDAPPQPKVWTFSWNKQRFGLKDGSSGLNLRWNFIYTFMRTNIIFDRAVHIWSNCRSIWEFLSPRSLSWIFAKPPCVWDTCTIVEEETSPLAFDGRADSHRHGDIAHANPRMATAFVERYFFKTPWYYFGFYGYYKKKTQSFKISSEAFSQFTSSEKALLHSSDEDNLERIIRSMRNIATINYDRRYVTDNEDILQNTARIAHFWTLSQKVHNSILYK